MCTCLYHVQLMAITLINARTCMLSRDQSRGDVISKNIVTIVTKQLVTCTESNCNYN